MRKLTATVSVSSVTQTELWRAAPVHWQAPASSMDLSSSEIHLWRLALRDNFPLETAFQVLNEEEQQRARRFHFANDRHRFAHARYFLRRVLGDYLKQPPQQLQFSYGEHGKPFLAEPSGLFFNLSHGGDWALLALARWDFVGVDIEKWRPVKDLDNLARRFFSAEEHRLVMDSNQPRQCFFYIWTAKEAYLKATGAGLGALESIRIAPGKAPQLWQNNEVLAQWRLHSFMAAPEYPAALVWLGGDMDLKYFDYN